MVQRIGQRCLSQPGQTQISALLKKKPMVTFQRVRAVDGEGDGVAWDPGDMSERAAMVGPRLW